MTIAHTLNREWDDFDAYLFDIDGTLITCTDATHYFAFCHALKLLSGRDLTLEGVVAHGNVDVGILRDALARAKVPESEWRPRLQDAQAAMGDFVYQRRGELCPDILPEVRSVLEHLRAKGAKLGVATGNLERIGQLKLERAGLWQYFDFGGWSDAHENRSDVFGAALRKAKRLSSEQSAVCVLGDTPYDVRAAHDKELPVIAVATGIYSYEELRETNPEMLLRSFAELFVVDQPAT
jgi:phosphoglycolate phosphatase-like HAD superfamily hydrolase